MGTTDSDAETALREAFAAFGLDVEGLGPEDRAVLATFDDDQARLVCGALARLAEWQTDEADVSGFGAIHGGRGNPWYEAWVIAFSKNPWPQSNLPSASTANTAPVVVPTYRLSGRPPI
jgi:hypothetical protein